jgi:peptidoglycan/xylan/chitin deacetylase (PgdA/CDA1 family)
MNVNSIARRAIKASALPLGVGDRVRRGDVVILLYHRVGSGTREIDLANQAFERQMAHLAEHAPPVTLDAALDGAGSGGTVVSVDDGYRDFCDHVLPTLVRHDIPAILYLATGLVSAGDPSSPHKGEALTWSDLREAVSTRLVTVGAHTHSHADLSSVSEQEAEEEMRRSKELIEDKLGIACKHFAYPWAVSSSAADRVVRGLFDTAALRWQTNRRGLIDRYRLGRTPVLRSDSDSFFRAKVQGILDKEALAYRLLRKGPWGRG